MREEDGAICVKVLGGVPWLWFIDDCVTEHEGEDCYPDLSDPATLGGLLALVREAWTFPTVHTCPRPGHHSAPRWSVRIWEGTAARPLLIHNYTTEAEALVAALEAAPS